MPIRHEDKEFIQSLSLFGALLGACLGAFAVVHLSDRARQDYARQSQTYQEQAALLKLNQTLFKSTVKPLVDEELIDRAEEHIAGPEPAAAPVKGFWLTIPRWGYWGLCGVSGAAGAVGGYAAVWLTGWTGSCVVYHFIRLLYKALRVAVPSRVSVKPLPVNKPTVTSGGIMYQRDDNRLLPTVVKLTFLLLFVLGVLAAIVGYVTAL
ncbi:MAG: hypothetical protein KBI46_06120 [Phycisphaerae bacterium]|nr:hypothetical protein [Phycisphaerae bacterium]